MERCWILLGMMGAGKSSVGRALAELSGREFVDTDILLQHRFGRPVHQIFEVYGEDAFRHHETSVLRSLEPSSIVLATGGGIVTRESNWSELGRLGATIYLNAGLSTLLSRLEASKETAAPDGGRVARAGGKASKPASATLRKGRPGRRSR